MKLTKKLIAILLCAALAFSAFAGCSDEQTPAETVAMGRYIEQSWQGPPLPEGYSIAATHLRPDGKIAVLAISASAEPSYYSTMDGKEWSKEHPKWLKALSACASLIQCIDFNSSGEGIVNYWGKELGGSGEEGSRIVRILPNGNIEQSPLGLNDPWEAAKAKETGASYMLPLYLKDIDIGEDGKAYLHSMYSGNGRLDPVSGELLASYFTDISAMTIAGDEAVTLLTPDSATRLGYSVDSYSLFFSDKYTGALNRILPAEKLKLTNGVAMTSDKDGGVCIADASGLYRISPGGESWELLLDGAMCSLSTPSMYLIKLIPHGENEFLAVFGDSTKEQLVNFVYSENTPTLPNNEITVFSMTHNDTIYQAAGAFRQKYPNTLVNVRTSEDMNEGGNGDDTRQTLNTEILAGKGPDVFVLADLPIESYIEKGVLADISSVVAPMLKADSVIPAIGKAYANGSGIFAVPARVCMPTLWGDEAALKASSDIYSMLDYFNRNPGKRAFGDMTPEHLLQQLAPYHLDALMGKNGVDISEAEKLLTAVVELAKTAEQPHAYDYFGTEKYLSQKGMTFSDELTDTMSIIEAPGTEMEDYFSVANNRALLMPALLYGFESIMQPNGVINKRIGGMTWDENGENDWNSDLPANIVNNVFRVFPSGGKYIPSCVVGVNAASKQKDLAFAFIEAVFSFETQSTDLRDGFPVNREAIRYGVQRKESWFRSDGLNTASREGTTELNDLVLEYAWPSKAMLTAVANRLDELQTPVMANYPLNAEYVMRECLPQALKMITDENATPRAAAEWLAGEMKLALEE